MIRFIHEFLHPHCAECKADKEDAKVCASCETLKLEIERLRHENDRLLDTILEKPKVIETIAAEGQKPVHVGRHLPFNTRRQMLEAEDRIKAKLMRDAPQPAQAAGLVGFASDNQVKKELSIEDIEKELGVTSEN